MLAAVAVALLGGGLVGLALAWSLPYLPAVGAAGWQLHRLVRSLGPTGGEGALPWRAVALCFGLLLVPLRVVAPGALVTVLWLATAIALYLAAIWRFRCAVGLDVLRSVLRRGRAGRAQTGNRTAAPPPGGRW